MRILIADDDPVSRLKLEFILTKGGYDVVAVADGAQALEHFWRDDAALLAILDVLMPGMDGIEVCRQLRQVRRENPLYIILLTVKDSKRDVVEGLNAGADDYVIKPFDQAELLARVGVGLKIVGLQQRLAERVRELENALARVRQLQGLLRKDTRVYEFGPYRLEAAERRLLRGRQAVSLTAKVFDLLLLLVQNGGHLLEKDELMRELWPDSEVEDNNLTVSMSILRKTLVGGDGIDYIETVPKRGYRFVARVRQEG